MLSINITNNPQKYISDMKIHCVEFKFPICFLFSLIEAMFW